MTEPDFDKIAQSLWSKTGEALEDDSDIGYWRYSKRVRDRSLITLAHELRLLWLEWVKPQ